MKSEIQNIKVKLDGIGNRRTAIYRISQEAARQMYATRGGADKNTPFQVYIAKCIADSGLKYPISEIELI